ncbi:MAG: helix-turn-helix domain-containing protein [Nitrospirae bacterium]|nr:helix-turn-helix domain-containing protein [Nitrospirota bacterium]
MKFLTVNDICALIQAKPSTVYQWAELGQIPCFKINGLLRFEEKEILEWLKNRKKMYNCACAGRRPGKEG